MAMVCPQCKASHEQALHCPSCGVRLLYQSHPRRGDDDAAASDSGQWLHTPIGRVLAAICLAQGLAYGLQMLCNAGVLAAAEDAERSVWSTLYGLVLLQTLQGLSLLVGGALAGAGQRRAALLGCVVGLVHALLFMLIQDVRGEQATEVAMYGQPILHIGFGLVGAIIGASIWRPLPTLAMPEFEIDKNFKPVRGRRAVFAALAGPIAWPRVVMGIVLVTAGFMWTPQLLGVVLEASQGSKVRVTDHLQAQLVTWEIVGLATLLGAAVAGATTRNGLKQGLCVGMGTSVVLVGIYLGNRAFPVDKTLYTVGCILPLTVAGGWFGGQLLPPVQVQSRRRRMGSAV
jgi:hypothetical protein